MKQKFLKYGAFLLLLVLIGGICFAFADSKSGLFIDEIYTYGLANNHEGPFLDSLVGGDVNNKILTRQDLLDYVVVNPGEEFDFRAVYDNQANDVHPPLYYWLFNIVFSLFPGLFSKWPAFVLNLGIYTAALVLLYAWLKELFGSEVAAFAGVALYGLSLIGLSTMLMIRMYVLVTMLTILLSYLIARLLREKKTSLYILTGFTIFAGLMTQYYFVFYAFFLCAAYVFHCLFKKDLKGAAVFALSAFAGVALMIVCFPYCFEHLFADSLVSGGNAIENLGNTAQYAERLMYYYKETRHGLKAAVVVALACAVCLIVFSRRVWAGFKGGRLNMKALLFIIPAFVTLVLVAIISPVLDSRYVYNIMPVFVVAVCMLISWLETSTSDMKLLSIAKYVVLIGLVLFSVWLARRSTPAYQYPEHAEYNTLLSQYSEEPCVYLTDGFHIPVSQDLVQLLSFEDLLMIPSAESEALDEYLERKPSDKCIVYIDISEFWSSGLKPDEMLPEFIENTEFNNYELLYAYGLSQTYLVTK